MNCSFCNKILSLDREEAVISLGLKQLCLDCSKLIVKPIQGIYPSFSGQNMIFVDKLGEEGIKKVDESEEIKYDYGQEEISDENGDEL